MKITLRELIDERCVQISKMIKPSEKKLNSFPDGKIKIARHGKAVYYYLTEDNKNSKLLKKMDCELRNVLLQKSYLEKVIKAWKKELQLLKCVRNQYPEIVAEEVYYNLPEERRVGVKPIVPTDEQFRKRWESQTYPVKPVKEGMPTYKTLKGDLVKSKSEVLIADRLFANGIPYKYECPLNVGGVIIHPDFTILRMSDRKVLYLEHCGKVGDSEYGKDMVKRINDYALAGIYQDDRLFFTFETDGIPLNTEVLDRIINDCFR